MTEQELAPRRQVRRFDIFAEWNRLKGVERRQMSPGDAQAYGLAVAKVVAARTLHGHEPSKLRDLKRHARGDDESGAVEGPWWEELGSPDEFERKVVERMGRAFYEQVFQPAVESAWRRGARYEDIRDELRGPWNARMQAARGAA